MDTPSITRVASLLGISSSLIISGFALSASHIIIPPLCVLPSERSLPLFRHTFEAGARIGIPLNALTAISFLVAAYYSPSSVSWDDNRTRYALAGLSSLATLPYTGLVMIPGIRKLLKAEEDEIVREKMGEEEVKEGLMAWERQNFMRGVMSFMSAVIGISTLAT